MQKVWLPYFLLRRFMLFNCFFFKRHWDFVAEA